MLRQETCDDGVADLIEAVSLLGQPMGEMRNAAQIDTLGARGIPPAAQVCPIPRNVGLKNALLQPRPRLRLDDDLLGHLDLLSGWMSREEIRIMRRAGLDECPPSPSASMEIVALPHDELRIIARCA